MIDSIVYRLCTYRDWKVSLNRIFRVKVALKDHFLSTKPPFILKTVCCSLHLPRESRELESVREGVSECEQNAFPLAGLVVAAQNRGCIYIHTGQCPALGLQGRLPSLTHCAAFCLHGKLDLQMSVTIIHIFNSVTSGWFSASSLHVTESTFPTFLLRNLSSSRWKCPSGCSPPSACQPRASLRIRPSGSFPCLSFWCLPSHPAFPPRV